jgi:hypothetical protein
MPKHKERFMALVMLVFGPWAGGCQPQAESGTRRVALKEGLESARKAQIFPEIAPGEVQSQARLESILERSTYALLNETKAQEIVIESRFTIPLPDASKIEVSDRAILEVGSADQWRTSHRSSWVEGGRERSLGRRCVYVDSHFFTGDEHGQMTQLKTRAREDKRCLSLPLELVTGWLTPLRRALRSKVVSADPYAGERTVKLELSGAHERAGHMIPITWPGPGTDSKSAAIYGPRGYLFATRSRLTSLTGFIRLKSANAALVEASLLAKFAVTKKSKEVELTVEVTLQSKTLSGEISAPIEQRVARDRPRVFRDMKDLLGVDLKRSARPALPKPDDQPRFTLGADGNLTKNRPKDPGLEDLPPADTSSTLLDEDVPR